MIIGWDKLKHLPYKMAKTEYRFSCIFCSDEDTGFHLYVNRSKKVFHCFKCGTKGKLVDQTNYGNLEHLDEYFKKLPSEEEAEKLVKSLPRCVSVTSRHRNDENYQKYYDYMISRKVFEKEMIANRVKFSKDRTGIYANTIIFPIYQGEELKYFVCRKLHGNPKYVNAPWEKGDTLYRPLGTRYPREYTVVCEGVFDALRIAKIAPVRALLGKEANKAQLEALIKLNKPILVCLDPDAYSYSLKLQLLLKSMNSKLKTAVVRLESDPGSTPRAVLKEALNNAYLSIGHGGRQ